MSVHYRASFVFFSTHRQLNQGPSRQCMRILIRLTVSITVRSPLQAGQAAPRPDALRETNRRSEWWRPMSTRRRAREPRIGDQEIGYQHKEMLLNPTLSNTTSTTTSPTSPTPSKTSRTKKLKSFFKRKPQSSDEQEKQLSSFGSSSQLRTPPTSDPGVSVNSDD